MLLDDIEKIEKKILKTLNTKVKKFANSFKQFVIL